MSYVQQTFVPFPGRGGQTRAYIVWRPGQPSEGVFVETWEEVAQAIEVAQGVITVALYNLGTEEDPTPPTLVVPATANVQCFGSVIFEGFAGSGGSGEGVGPLANLFFEDGAQLVRPYRFENVSISATPTIRPFLSFPGVVIEGVLLNPPYLHFEDSEVRLLEGSAIHGIEFDGSTVGSITLMQIRSGLFNEEPSVPLVFVGPTTVSFLGFFNILRDTSTNRNSDSDNIFGGGGVSTLNRIGDSSWYPTTLQTFWTGFQGTQAPGFDNTTSTYASSSKSRYTEYLDSIALPELNLYSAQDVFDYLKRRRTYQRFFVDGDLAAGLLTVEHGFGVKYDHVDFYDDNDVKAIPSAVTAVDGNTLTADFSAFQPLAGKWKAVVLRGDDSEFFKIRTSITSPPAGPTIVTFEHFLGADVADLTTQFLITASEIPGPAVEVFPVVVSVDANTISADFSAIPPWTDPDVSAIVFVKIVRS